MGEKIRGAVVLLVLGVLCVGALLTWPYLWLLPFAAFCWWVRVNERRIKNHSPGEGEAGPTTEEPQVGGVTITRVGESGTIVSHPSEKRSYRVESHRAPDA